jgi:integrative and conjugative element protein (TIGR02256 family)
MPEGVIAFGESLADQDPAHLLIGAAWATAVAVREHPDFELRELRSLKDKNGDSEILVVDCTCDRVWSQKSFGIRYREPLALRFYRDLKHMPEARALRNDFPVLLHTNEVEQGEPIGLCIYHEPWSAIRRTWTPQKFLARVQWWLAESANGTLHPADQPPEQLYFESPFSVVLPRKFDELISRKDLALVLEPRSSQADPRWVASASFLPLNQYMRTGDRHYACVALSLPAIPHGRPERYPTTLAEVHDRLSDRGAPVAETLFAEIQRIAVGAGLAHVLGQKTLLILTVPVVNPAGGPPRVQRKGFLINTGLGQLGVMAGVLMRTEKGDKYVAAVTIGGLQLQADWRKATLMPLEIREPFTEDLARRYSGVKDAGPVGVLAGVGALGSTMADIWAREGWGRWTYIDPDLLMPHNLARHRGYENQVGTPKIDVVRQLESTLYPGLDIRPGFRGAANDFADSNILESMRGAELVVDATTTIEVPRDLALRNDVPRSASVFLTPSGNDSVLLLEDSSRTMRLDVLEAQYYRLVLNATWGETHLRGHRGNLWVGAGCRDISNVISGESVQLHAAILARQVRLRAPSTQAAIQVWRANPDTGTVDTTSFGATPPLIVDMDDMELVWDEGLRSKIRAMREEGLPNETGGVLLGYFDLVNHRIYAVDALPAPPDSQERRSEFERGIEGLEAKVQAAQARTANIVGYIGEWHSHPRRVQASPSGLDIRLLLHLAIMLGQDGLPALMLIVGEDEERWIAGSVRG